MNLYPDGLKCHGSISDDFTQDLRNFELCERFVEQLCKTPFRSSKIAL